MSIAISLLCATLAAQVSRPAAATRPVAAGNPILRGADPDVLVVRDAVWMVPTFSARRGEAAFYAFSSRDLRVWQRHGPILDFKNVPWVYADGQKSHGAWAPTMVARDGKYFFYYAVGDQNVTVSRIGVAVGDSPAGPFVDSGKPMPIVGARDKFEAIDPMVFVDPKTGVATLYAGGSNGATLRVFELNRDMVTIARERPIPQPERFTEGPFVHERGGVYYLSYSHGNYRDHTYSVHYATGPSPLGPWTYRGAILTSDATHKGPGHHAFFRSDVSGQWYVAYHRWDGQRGDGPYRGSRGVCIDRMSYRADGTIEPIVMTDGAAIGDRFGR